jgi:hypothetical protein
VGNKIIKLVSKGGSCGLVEITAKNHPITLRAYLGYEGGTLKDREKKGEKELEALESVKAKYDWGKNLSPSSEYWIYVYDRNGNILNAENYVTINSIDHNYACGFIKDAGQVAPLNMK